ncbi:polyprenyl synthetase family protein [Gryllotalpicola sp.]|uniref:polyprenyl synthetase family protein n=1 Tax=Gryllotalpicola sp. TaxID=1932787 RepID=UPI002623E189|nr:polyprenyl synthetase family protein [Gryllotalpicola sp.]
MSESTRLAESVQARLDRFFADRDSIVGRIGPDVATLLTYSRQFLSGGKRFRAQFCHWGWRGVAAYSSAAQTEAESEAALGAAAALEVFHAAALVHDDVIDSSDTRRGAPSAQVRFAGLHYDKRWTGDGTAFGRAAAILLGDLLLGWSDELLDESLALLDSPARARAARAVFTEMRTDVTAGQYLDVLEESAWVERSEKEVLASAERVIVFKSAKYSIEQPLLLGAAIAGADETQLATLKAYGLPLGIAFQLRDDLLGVFGDTAITGKPSGDDLREGKRTVLVALTRTKVPAGVRRTIDELLGDPGLSPEQILMLQSAMRDSGAVEDLERIIDRNVLRANTALDEASLAPDAISALRALARSVTDRAS